MDLREFCKKYFNNKIDIINNHSISKITDNSKEVVKNAVFVAIDGINNKGIDYIDEALDYGARTIIYSDDNIIKEEEINYIKVQNSFNWYNEYLLFENKKKLDKIKIVGITGTNGKTTSSYIAYNILRKYYNVCLIGTNGTYLSVKHLETHLNSKNTTPKLAYIIDIIKKISKINIIILEVSSEAIYYNRLGNLKFDIIGLTNIGHDHVNTHLDYNNYINTKSSLFKCFKESGLKCAIINYDEKYKDCFITNIENDIKLLSYGINNGNIKAELLSYNKTHMMIKVYDLHHEVIFGTNLLGYFNVYNILLAFQIALVFKIDFMKIVESFSKDIIIPGRYTYIRHLNRDFYIDYAHNPEAVREYLKSINHITDNMIICVIGAGGCKDAKKRPKMGYFAKMYSDILILTEDTSREEDLNNIINDLILELDSTDYTIVKNRVEAIKYAYSISKENDVIVLLGMGNDYYGELNDKIVVESLK